MSYDFPNTPTLGQAFGNYVWDGEKWQLPKGVTPDRATIYAAPFDAMAYNGMQINGSMEVSQELGGTATGTNGKYILDGWTLWYGGTSGLSARQQPTTIFPGFKFCLYCSVGITEPAMGANDFVVFYQPIEGWRVSRLAWGTANAQPITLGFWTAHHRVGLYTGAVRNSAGNRAYAFTYNQNVADGIEYKTITIPGDTAGTWLTDNGIGMMVTLAMAAGTTYTAPSNGSWLSGNYNAGAGQINAVAATSDAFAVTGFFILPGVESPTAARSALIMRPFDQELVTCKRYLQKYADPGNGIGFGFEGMAFNATQATVSSLLPQEMRGVPTVTFSSLRLSDIFSSSQPVTSFIGMNSASRQFQDLVFAVGAGLVAGRWMRLEAVTGGFLMFDARL